MMCRSLGHVLGRLAVIAGLGMQLCGPLAVGCGLAV